MELGQRGHLLVSKFRGKLRDIRRLPILSSGIGPFWLALICRKRHPRERNAIRVARFQLSITYCGKVSVDSLGRGVLHAEVPCAEGLDLLFELLKVQVLAALVPGLVL